MTSVGKDNAIIAFPTKADEPELSDGFEVEDEDEKETGEVQVKIRGRMCTVAYDKYGLTPRLMKRILEVERLSGSGSTADTMRVIDICTDVISKLALDWDAKDARGNAIPITPDAMEDKLDMNSLMEVMMAIQGELMPGEATGSDSSAASQTGGSGTSSAQAKSASRSGTRTQKQRHG